MVYWWFTGLIRENSNVVYFKHSYGNEGILYDFNLEIGDTANITSLYCDEMQVIVGSIDTVNYFGVDRKRWLLDWSNDYWIEGIGNSYGPFHTNFYQCIFDVWFELLCYSENDTLLYIKQGEDDCFQFAVGIEEEHNYNQLTVRPNPVLQGQSFTIQANTAINNVCIYSTDGFLVKHITFYPGKNVLVETGQLVTGLYLVRIKSEANQVFNQKIIIQ